jgi:hypothetical protein
MQDELDTVLELGLWQQAPRTELVITKQFGTKEFGIKQVGNKQCGSIQTA